MRFSKTISKAITRSLKGKDATSEVEAVVAAIEKAVVAYKGTSKGAFKANKDHNVETVRGCMPMATLDDASLLVLVQAEHLNIVTDTCQTTKDENVALNAELARGIATNAIILGACFHLTQESEGNDFL